MRHSTFPRPAVPLRHARSPLPAVMTDTKHGLSQLYLPGLPMMQQLEHQLQALINRRLPRLAAHFHGLGVHPTMFSAQWLLTIFTYNFPFATVVRVWDAFLAEGWKVVFRVALAVLRIAERKCAGPTIATSCAETGSSPLCCMSRIPPGPHTPPPASRHVVPTARPVVLQLPSWRTPALRLP
jgi:hypothetical protein